MIRHLLTQTICLFIALGLLSCQEPEGPMPYDGNVWATHSKVDYFNRLHAFGVNEGLTYPQSELERRAVE